MILSGSPVSKEKSILELKYRLETKRSRATVAALRGGACEFKGWRTKSD